VNEFTARDYAAANNITEHVAAHELDRLRRVGSVVLRKAGRLNYWSFAA
jgi:hypothetical protein